MRDNDDNEALFPAALAPADKRLVCPRHGLTFTDRAGYCKEQVSPIGRRPVRYCGFNCVPAPAPAQPAAPTNYDGVARELVYQWNQHPSLYEPIPLTMNDEKLIASIGSTDSNSDTKSD